LKGEAEKDGRKYYHPHPQTNDEEEKESVTNVSAQLEALSIRTVSSQPLCLKPKDDALPDQLKLIQQMQAILNLLAPDQMSAKSQFTIA
jgi:hypothetical protein